MATAEEDPRCVRCGAPVRVNKDRDDLFERMHDLRSHLEFEHEDHDPDEFCHVADCPWQPADWKATRDPPADRALG